MSSKPKRFKKIKVSYTEKREFIREFSSFKSRRKKNFTRTEKYAITRAYNFKTKYGGARHKPVEVDEKVYKNFRGAKFQGKIYVPKLTDTFGIPLKAQRIRIDKNGNIKISLNNRTEVHVALTRQQVKRLANGIPTPQNTVIQEIFKNNKAMQKRWARATDRSVKITYSSSTQRSQHENIASLVDYLHKMNEFSLMQVTGLLFLTHEIHAPKYSNSRTKKRRKK